MTNTMAAIVAGLQARLEGDLRGTRAVVAHPGARGEASEEDWLRVLKDHLPYRYQADRAFVIDSAGASSEQIDIVIYDRQYSPFLYNQANQRFIPAESVYAVFEVKQNLSKEHVEYAGAKAASVRRLHRTSSVIAHAGGSYDPRPLPPIIAGLITYQSSWQPPFGSPFEDALRSLDGSAQLDLGCVLLSGAFEVEYEHGRVSAEVSPADHSLVQFLMRLLKQLQGLGTAPAIDYSAYLSSFAIADNAADGGGA